MALSWISNNNDIDYLNKMIRAVEGTLSNDYNDLDNIPIIRITSTTNNPQKIWELKEGMYLIEGIVYVDNATSYEVSNLMVAMTAKLENGKYVLSAFIPFLKGLYEYVLKENSSEYEQHQIVVLATHEKMLTRYNETPYEPIGDYNPSTKKYVDERVEEIYERLDEIGVNEDTLNSLKNEDKIRDIKINALLNQDVSRNLSISTNVHNFNMPLSMDKGIININKMVGDTLVNVCDQEEPIAITKLYTVENGVMHIPLQGEYDGKCRPVVYGNTLVNHNANWDDTLQTGTEINAVGLEDVNIEGVKGSEVSVVVEGNTVLNHALGKTASVVTPIESENSGNHVTLNVANDMSSVVEIEGRTMVNVCDQKDPIAITKSYTVENSGNHIALQGEYDGSCRPVVQGNTMVNLCSKEMTNTSTPHFNSSNYRDYTIASNMAFSTPNIIFALNRDIVSNGVYTLRISTQVPDECYQVHIRLRDVNADVSRDIKTYDTTSNKSIEDTVSFSPNSSFTPKIGCGFQIIYYFDSVENAQGKSLIIEPPMIFEGDLTQTPELIPTEYVEGLKSSFEDGKIPENVLKNNGCTIYASDLAYGTVILNDVLDLSTQYTIFIMDKDDLIDNNSICSGSGAIVWHHNTTSKKYKFTTPSTFPEENVRVYLYPKNGNSFVNVDSVKIFILEGDWTHLTEEDWNNLGKYKVEYKVTGENLATSDNWEMGTGGGVANIGITYEQFKKSATNRCRSINPIKVKPNTTYSMNAGTGSLAVVSMDKDTLVLADSGWLGSSFEFTTEDKCEYIALIWCKYDNPDFTLDEIDTNIKVYESSKEYTKTFYLNSPLLEGDTIEDVNGVATHVKRYGKVVLDGSENWVTVSSQTIDNTYLYQIQNSNTFVSSTNNAIELFCDKMPCTSANQQWDTTITGITLNTTKNISIRVENILTATQLKTWLSENPLTVVAKLVSPIYEPISTESILCDSYVNGHLDFDSAVPIEKVKFQPTSLVLKYIQPSTQYVVQFDSDNVGKVSWGVGGTLGEDNSSIVKGINKFTVTTNSTINNDRLYMTGIGFNASNIVVTEAIDTDFDYFEGLKSSYEYEVTEDGKYKVDVKVTGKNLLDISNVHNNAADVVSVTLLSNGIKMTSLSRKTYQNAGVTINVKPNTIYTLQCKSDNVNTVDIYDEDGKYYYYLGNCASGKSFSSGENKKVQIRFYNTWDVSKTNTVTYTDIQLEEGNQTTSYEPYFESSKTFYLNSPLLEGDKIVTKNGKVYHYHKMGMEVLDGSEGDISQTSGGKWYRFSVENNAGQFVYQKVPKKLGYNTSICDKFLNTGNSDPFTPGKRKAFTYTDHPNLDNLYFNFGTSNTSMQEWLSWLSVNPTTVVYELASPYYELIDEYNNTILNIPNTVAHLTHTSTVPVNNTVFTNYKDELNVLEANTQYRVMFDCDTANVPFTVTLGGTSQEVTSIKGTHSLLITTPSELVDKNLVIDGIGRCGIDNIRIFKGDVEYDYVKGLWSGYEERKLENLYDYVSYGYQNSSISYSDNIFTITIGTGFYPSIRLQLLSPLNIKKQYTIIFEAKSTVPNKRIKWGGCKASTSSAWNVVQLPDLSNVKYLTTSYKQYCSIISYRLDDKANDNIGFGFFTQNDNQWQYEKIYIKNILILEGDWTDNPPTYEEVMANEGKYAVKVKLDTNANIFGKGGRL